MLNRQNIALNSSIIYGTNSTQNLTYLRDLFRFQPYDLILFHPDDIFDMCCLNETLHNL